MDRALLWAFFVSGEKAGSMPDVSNPSWLVKIGDIRYLSCYPMPLINLFSDLFGELFYCVVWLLY